MFYDVETIECLNVISVYIILEFEIIIQNLYFLEVFLKSYLNKMFFCYDIVLNKLTNTRWIKS